MSNLLVEDYLKMAGEKRNANYRSYESGKMSYYKDAILINFTKSVEARKQKKRNRKRCRTVSETSETSQDMIKRMKEIDEEIKESSESSMVEEESEDVWEDAKEDFEEPVENQAYGTFFNIFMKFANFLHF